MVSRLRLDLSAPAAGSVGDADLISPEQSLVNLPAVDQMLGASNLADGKNLVGQSPMTKVSNDLADLLMIKSPAGSLPADGFRVPDAFQPQMPSEGAPGNCRGVSPAVSVPPSPAFSFAAAESGREAPDGGRASKKRSLGGAVGPRPDLTVELPESGIQLNALPLMHPSQSPTDLPGEGWGSLRPSKQPFTRSDTVVGGASTAMTKAAPLAMKRFRQTPVSSLPDETQLNRPTPIFSPAKACLPNVSRSAPADFCLPDTSGAQKLLRTVATDSSCDAIDGDTLAMVLRGESSHTGDPPRAPPCDLFLPALVYRSH
jgi:hypothetical protein